jgi:hypothetical protein
MQLAACEFEEKYLLEEKCLLCQFAGTLGGCMAAANTTFPFIQSFLPTFFQRLTQTGNLHPVRRKQLLPPPNPHPPAPGLFLQVLLPHLPCSSSLSVRKHTGTHVNQRVHRSTGVARKSERGASRHKSQVLFPPPSISGGRQMGEWEECGLASGNQRAKLYMTTAAMSVLPRPVGSTARVLYSSAV